MSDDSQEEEELKVEIQKLLLAINTDMVKVKNELSAVHDLISENASLPMTARLANEKLIIAAKEAGIDLENLEEAVAMNDSEEDKSEEVNKDKEKAGGSKKKAGPKSKTTKSNADALADAAEELTEKVKRTLRNK